VDNKHNLVVATHTINRNDLNALGVALEAKKIWGRYFTVLVDKGYHNGRKLPNAYNNITTIVAHPTPGSKESHATGLFGSKFQYNAKKRQLYMPQGETLKLQEDGTKKVRTKGINLKIPHSSLPECPVKHLCTSRPAGREIDRASTRKALKKINAIRKPTIIPNTTRDKRTYIRYYKKTMGLQSH
jgi:hypothetical protein